MTRLCGDTPTPPSPPDKHKYEQTQTTTTTREKRKAEKDVHAHARVEAHLRDQAVHQPTTVRPPERKSVHARSPRQRSGAKAAFAASLHTSPFFVGAHARGAPTTVTARRVGQRAGGGREGAIPPPSPRSPKRQALWRHTRLRRHACVRFCVGAPLAHAREPRLPLACPASPRELHFVFSTSPPPSHFCFHHFSSSSPPAFPDLPPTRARVMGSGRSAAFFESSTCAGALLVLSLCAQRRDRNSGACNTLGARRRCAQRHHRDVQPPHTHTHTPGSALCASQRRESRGTCILVCVCVCSLCTAFLTLVMPSSLFSAPPSTPGLAAFTYQARTSNARASGAGSDAAGAATRSATSPITPRRVVPPAPSYRDGAMRTSATGVASPAQSRPAWAQPHKPQHQQHHFNVSTYTSSVLRASAGDEQGPVLAPPPPPWVSSQQRPASLTGQYYRHQDRAQQQQQQHSHLSDGGADGALGASPQPRAPSPRQQRYSALPRADLRYPSNVTFTPPPPAPHDLVSASVQAPAAAPAPCWMCEAWCSGGPGSTWVAAPALFFAPGPVDGQPVSSLTLCTMCAAAVSVDTTATSREVLERCHRTPVIRYRTAAYVNAVREYALLLRLMAEHVLRSSARLQSIQSSVMRQRSSSSSQASPRHVYADEGAGEDVDGAGGEAAAYLAHAAHAPLASMPHALQEKVLGQLVEALEDVLARDQRAVRLAASGAPSPDAAGAAAPSLSEVMASRERHVFLDELARVERQLLRLRAPAASSHGAPSATFAARVGAAAAAAGGADDDSGGMVRSPRPMGQQPAGASPAPSRRAGAEAALLAAAADPRRFTSQLRRRTAAEDARPSPSREPSPPALTSSPQRGRPHVAAVPFPLAATSPRRARGSAGRAEDSEGLPPAPAYRGPRDSNNDGAVGSVDDGAREAEAAGGRRVMQAMVDSAMWEAYRGAGAAGSDGGALAAEDGGGGDGTRTARAVGDSAGWQLLDYFAGRLPDAPPLRVGGSTPHTFPVAAARSPRSPLPPSRRQGAADLPSHARRDAQNASTGDAAAAAPMRDRAAGTSAALRVVASPSPAELADLYGSDAGALHRQLHRERQLRREAEEAVLATQGRVAALEATTNDMAEALLTHRLSVTFRGHLSGMEMLVARWTRLAQNFCLQKSLLFAEETALMVRQLQRASCGVAPLWAPTSWTPPQRHIPAAASARDAEAVKRTPGRHSTSPFVEARVDAAARRRVQEASENDELWVSRGSDDGEGRAVTTPSAAVRAGATRAAPSPTPSPLRHDAPATAPFPFPEELKLRPLSLRV